MKGIWKEKDNTWRRPDDVNRNVIIEREISVIRNRSVDEESESDSQDGFLQIAQGKGRESVTFNIATLKQTHKRHTTTHTSPKHLIHYVFLGITALYELLVKLQMLQMKTNNNLYESNVIPRESCKLHWTNKVKNWMQKHQKGPKTTTAQCFSNYNFHNLTVTSSWCDACDEKWKYSHWELFMPTGDFTRLEQRWQFFFLLFFSQYLSVSGLINKRLGFLCCTIQAIRANSEGDSVPGEGKIYILGWNMKITLLMRAVHDKNQIMKPKGWKW